jgi:RNA polymerase sigma-19 factor, ECF subfamily
MQNERALSINAIGEIYQVNHGWLVGWLNRRIGCHHTAADLAQDTFTRILGARESLVVTEARALLTTIAKGLMVDHIRRATLEAAYLDALAQLPETQTPSAEARMLLLETLHEIDAMLDGLPPKARQAFLLSQLDGLTYAEIAMRQNVSVSSVQKYMTQAYTACYRVMLQA